jgi:predicted nucleotidyltransferase
MNTVQRNGERISKELRDTITLRYKRITKAINSEFWGSDSDTAHSRYVGSYGRGTAIDTSDIDILVELPRYEYERFDAHKGNGQSRLLQVVKAAIQTTYPRSNIRADGQVIVVDFSDGIKFEVLPAFKQIDWLGYWNGKYDYPDTNMGGNWRSTNPKAEQDAMRERNRESNGLLFDTCRHMREIRDTHFRNYHLSGIVIDSYVYHHIADWHWLLPGEKSDKPQGTYEKKLYNECPVSSFSLTAPGSGDIVDTRRDVDCLNKVLNYMSKE